MRKKILSFIVIATIGFNSAFAYTQMETVDEAIKLTKAAGDYGKISLALPSGNTNTVWLLEYETTQLEGTFKRFINDSRDMSQRGYTWFTLALQTQDQVWINNIYSGSAGTKIRAQSVFLDRLYQSFVTLRNNPSRPQDVSYNNNNNTTIIIPPTTNNWTYVTPNNWTYINPNTYTVYTTYQTASNKSYNIWRSQDGRYRFNTRASNGFRTTADLQNYLEYQNRIIYQAPNGRMYGIWKRNNRFYFNRDEGSISNNSRYSVSDVKSYLNQHNQPIAWCLQASAWRCY